MIGIYPTQLNILIIRFAIYILLHIVCLFCYINSISNQPNKEIIKSWSVGTKYVMTKISNPKELLVWISIISS